MSRILEYGGSPDTAAFNALNPVRPSRPATPRIERCTVGICTKPAVASRRCEAHRFDNNGD